MKKIADYAIEKETESITVKYSENLIAFEFNINTFKEDVRRAGELPIFEVSCKTKDGLSVWLDWLGVKKK